MYVSKYMHYIEHLGRDMLHVPHIILTLSIWVTHCEQLRFRGNERSLELLESSKSRRVLRCIGKGFIAGMVI